MTPIAHQIGDDSEDALQDDAGGLHAAVGVGGEFGGESAAGIGVGEDGVTFAAEGEGEEFGACGFLIGRLAVWRGRCSAIGSANDGVLMF